MDQTYSTTNLIERKRGQHLGAEERGAIQALKKQGYSNRAIARTINCSPSTVGYELPHDTSEYCGCGRKAGFPVKHGKQYTRTCRRCHRLQSIARGSKFIRWMVNMVRKHSWSFDTCVGRACREQLLLASEIHCIKLYTICCGRISC